MPRPQGWDHRQILPHPVFMWMLIFQSQVLQLVHKAYFLDWAFSSAPVTFLRKSHWLLSLQDFFIRTIASFSLHQQLLPLRMIFPSTACPSRVNTGHLNIEGVKMDRDESCPEEQYLIKPWFFPQITELSFIASFCLNQCILKYTLKTSDFLRSGSVEYQKWRIQRSSICTKSLLALLLIPLCSPKEWRLVGVFSELMPNLIQKFSQWTLNPNSLCVSLTQCFHFLRYFYFVSLCALHGLSLS